MVTSNLSASDKNLIISLDHKKGKTKIGFTMGDEFGGYRVSECSFDATPPEIITAFKRALDCLEQAYQAEQPEIKNDHGIKFSPI